MKLNVFETILVNNPVRTIMLDRTVAWLYQEALAPALKKTLEIGCGQGTDRTQEPSGARLVLRGGRS